MQKSICSGLWPQLILSVIQITKQGEQLIAMVFPKHLSELDKMLVNLTQADKKQLIDLLKKLNGI